MLNVTVKALTDTDIQVSVIYDGSDGSDPPTFVEVNEFDQHGNQLPTSGNGSPINGFYSVFHDPKPATTYFYQLCVQADGDSLYDCSPQNQYSGKTLPAIKAPTPTPQPQIWITSVQVFPAQLVKQGSTYVGYLPSYFKLSWESNVDTIGISVEVTSGSATHGINVGGVGAGEGRSGTISTLSAARPGATNNVRVRGQLNGSYTPFSAIQSFLAPTNPPSMRAFMFASGIAPSKGIKNLLSQSLLPASFRALMQI
jgi:hypothetical protein